MAFEITDFEHSYVSRGDDKGLFQIIRADVSDDSIMYVAYMNESGSYFILKITASADVYTIQYYSSGKKPSLFSADWANRSGLTFNEYYQRFSQG